MFFAFHVSLDNLVAVNVDKTDQHVTVTENHFVSPVVLHLHFSGPERPHANNIKYVDAFY